MPKPNPNESHDQFINRCMGDEEMVKNYENTDQRYAVCESKWQDYKGMNIIERYKQAFVDSYTDYPQAATENAKIALRWAEENGWGDCGTPVGKARANQLANREPISKDTISRMAGFERHRQNSDKALGDGCGRLMWLAWGGDEGIEWAQRKLEQLNKGNFAGLKISIDYDDVLSTEKGKELAKRLIADKNTIYIISARRDTQGMLNTAKALGIPESRVYATGSNKAKVEKIKELGINTHYDNNPDVIKALGQVGKLFTNG